MKVVMMTKPWISGPKELLLRGLGHMNKKSDFLYLKKLYSIRNSLIYDDIKIKNSTLAAAKKRIEELTQKLR